MPSTEHTTSGGCWGLIKAYLHSEWYQVLYTEVMEFEVQSRIMGAMARSLGKASQNPSLFHKMNNPSA